MSPTPIVLPSRILKIARFLRILLSVTLSGIAAMILASLLWEFDKASGGDLHYTYRAARPLLILGMFGAPFFLNFIIFTTGLFYCADRVILRGAGPDAKRSMAVLAVIFAGVLSGYIVPVFGAISLFLLFYWLMTGRVAGRPGWSIRNLSRTA
ncbi:MAG: hypothetical protein ABF241_05950 [Yoonia sp.]